MGKNTDTVVDEKSASEEIWDSIKDLNINMFALPAQKVSTYCHKVEVEPSKLYLKFKITSFLPALEDLIGKKYLLEMNDKWLTISKREE